MKPRTITRRHGVRLRESASRGAVLLCLGLAIGVAAPYAAAAVGDLPGFSAPKFKKPVKAKLPNGAKVNVIADRIAYDGKSKIATATGTVRITYGPYTLTATKVVYDTTHDIFKANGSVVFREPNGNVVEAGYAELSNKFKEGFARHLKALLTNDVTITADYARRYENGVTVYEHAAYTACKTCIDEGGTPIWQIVARQATHDQNNQTLYYRDMSFEIGGVPVLWLPYLSYPDPTVKRRSGFLLVQPRYGGEYGFGLQTPYFWEVAPNADLTFSPLWTTKQGPLADVEWRHRLASGIYDIHGYGIYQLDPPPTSYSNRWRGAVTSKGEFEINDVWSWGWNGTLTGDKTFLDDYDIDNSNLVTSDVHVTGMADRTYISAQALHYQTLLTTEDQSLMPAVLPYLTASHTFASPVLGGELGFDVSAYSLSRDIAEDANNLGTDQTRAVADLHWRKQMINGLGQMITPFAQLRGDVYVSDNVPVDGSASLSESTSHLLPSAGIDMRWPFMAAHGFGQSVLTPVAQIISASNEPDDAAIANEDSVAINFDHTSLFLDDRFTGLDRYEGGTRANAGVMYSLLGDNGGFLRMSVGESFHIAGTNSFTQGSGLDGPRSDLVGAVALQPNENWRFTYEVRSEEDLSAINSQEASIGLTLDRISGSLSYADILAAPEYGRPDRGQQIWGDASYALGEAWSVFSGFRYDLQSDSFREKTLGLQYSCDCMNAQLAYSETANEEIGGAVEQKISLSLEFRTIGSVGGGFGF